MTTAAVDVAGASTHACIVPAPTPAALSPDARSSARFAVFPNRRVQKKSEKYAWATFATDSCFYKKHGVPGKIELIISSIKCMSEDAFILLIKRLMRQRGM